MHVRSGNIPDICLCLCCVARARSVNGLAIGVAFFAAMVLLLEKLGGSLSFVGSGRAGYDFIGIQKRFVA